MSRWRLALAFTVACSPWHAAAQDEAQLEAQSWEFAWKGWDGLRYELVRNTRWELDVPVFRVDELRLAGYMGGRVELDVAAFDTSGSLSGFNPGTELRRARIRFKGDGTLVVPFLYKIELGYVPNRFSLNDFYVAVPDLPYIGTLKTGVFQPTMGLQSLISSWDIGLMEPAAPVQALAPGVAPGVNIGRTWGGELGTWSIGAYGSGLNSASEYGSEISNLGTLIGRLTWLPVDAAGQGDAAQPTLVHLGLSGNLQVAGDGEVQFRSRPESHIAPYVIDTGTLAADRAATLGLEVAWTRGDITAQAEWLHAHVDVTGVGTLNFFGLYAQLAWVATGESRPYDRRAGYFGRLQPQREFDLGPDTGWGALELALRASYTDLSDGPVQGGKLGLLMGGLTWYLSPHLAWRLDAGAGRVRGNPNPGKLLLMQTRFGIDF